MFRHVLTLAMALSAGVAAAGEEIAGTDIFNMDERQWTVEAGTVFWTIRNTGTSEPTKGPLGADSVECHGSGFWKAGSERGEGICVYGAGDDVYVRTWRITPGGVGEWRIVSASGRYEGLTGEGRGASRIENDRRINDWVGEIDYSN